jgi:hypothetical protein
MGYHISHCVGCKYNFPFETLNEYGQRPVEVFKGDKLHQMMDKFLALYFPNVRNLIASFKHRPKNRRYVSSIHALKANSGYYHI